MSLHCLAIWHRIMASHCGTELWHYNMVFISGLCIVSLINALHCTLVQNEIILFRNYFDAFMTTRRTDWHIEMWKIMLAFSFWKKFEKISYWIINTFLLLKCSHFNKKLSYKISNTFEQLKFTVLWYFIIWGMRGNCIWLREFARVMSSRQYMVAGT